MDYSKPNTDVINIVSARTNIPFYASAYFKFNSDGTKDKNKAQYLSDKTPLSTNKKYNVAKAYLQDTPYLIIDIDTPDQAINDQLLNSLPTLNQTLQTQSTTNYKKHYWVIVSEEFTKHFNGRSIGEYAPNVDILKTGVIQEGYPSSKIINDVQPLPLTAEEEQHLIQHLPKKQSTPTGSFYTSFEQLLTLNKLLKVQGFDNLSSPDKKNVWKQLLPKSHQRLLPKKGKQPPELDYQSFNDIVAKLSYNKAINVNVRNDIIHYIIISQGWNPLSRQTEQRLNQILPSLPANEGYISQDLNNFMDILKLSHIPLYNCYVIRVVSRSQTMFIMIDDTTLYPVEMEDGNYLLTKSALEPFVQEQIRKDIAEGTHEGDTDIVKLSRQFIDINIRNVRVTYNPSQMSLIEFDERQKVPTYNLVAQSKYYEMAVPQDTFPDNVVSRLIYSVFGEYQEFYLHYLAHLMYSPIPPQTIPFIVSSQSGTGKTTTAQGIPLALSKASRNVSIDNAITGWAQIMQGARGILVNDIGKIQKSIWTQFYAFTKDVTTGGQRKTLNSKYGGIIVKESPRISLSMSSNYYQYIDEDDRRYWVIKPQHLITNQDGNTLTPKLDEYDATQIQHMFEESPQEYYEELQQLANYLKHLYINHKDKYLSELTRRAPHTEYRQEMINQNVSYTARLVTAIKHGPDELSNILEEQYQPFIYKFIYLATHDGKFCAPYKFLAHLIHLVQTGEHEVKTKKSQIAEAIGIDVREFKKRSDHFYTEWFHNPKHFTKDEFGIVDDFTQDSCIISLEPGIRTKYQQALMTLAQPPQQQDPDL